MEKPQAPIFWNIRYQDENGNHIIEQMHGSPSEIKVFIDKFLERGIDATAQIIKLLP